MLNQVDICMHGKTKVTSTYMLNQVDICMHGKTKVTSTCMLNQGCIDIYAKPRSKYRYQPRFFIATIDPLTVSITF